MGLKDKVKTMTLEQMAELLSTNGMLVKRPLVILADKVLIGFKEEQWQVALLSDKQD
jgi:arsenate reductase